jgi:hypothetical protein
MKKLLLAIVLFIHVSLLNGMASLQKDLTNLQMQLTKLQKLLPGIKLSLADDSRYQQLLAVAQQPAVVLSNQREFSTARLNNLLDYLEALKKEIKAGRFLERALPQNIQDLSNVIVSEIALRTPPPMDYQTQIDGIFKGYMTSGRISTKDYDALEELFEKCGRGCISPANYYRHARARLDYFKTNDYDPIFKDVTLKKPLAIQQAFGKIVQQTKTNSIENLLESLLREREYLVTYKNSVDDPNYENKKTVFNQMIVHLFDFALLSITQQFNEDGLYKGDGKTMQPFSKEENDLFNFIVKFFNTAQLEKGQILKKAWAQKITDAVGKLPIKGGKPSPLERAVVGEKLK